MRLIALVLAAIALTGCETTAKKSAKLERLAGQRGEALKSQTLSIAHASTTVKVLRSSLVSSPEGLAAVLTLRNLTDHTVGGLPLELTVRAAGGTALYTNTAPGLAHSLQSVPLIAAHGELTWIDDQIQGASGAADVTAELGQGPRVNGAPPSIAVQGAHVFQEAGVSGVKGTVVNHSQVDQRELVVYATARRGGKVVAAGRAVLSQLPAGASLPFQAFLIGASAAGAQLQVSAPASTI